MKEPLAAFVASRFWALVRKEIRQILRDRQLLFLLLFPPTLQLVIFGFALNPEVQHLKLGVLDLANSANSRELVAVFANTGVFEVERFASDHQSLAAALERGRIHTGLVIPADFERTIARDQAASVQVLVDAVDANTAGIVRGYVTEIVSQFSRGLDPEREGDRIDARLTVLYNPGLVTSWFFVPGVLGVVLTLTGALVASATVVREKDTGTLEQLLITPARDWEILLAKLTPLTVLLLVELFAALSLARLIFNLPVRGSLLLFVGFSLLYILVCIGIGTLMGTLARDQRQTQLVSFFITLPIIQLSGAIAPIDSLHPALQRLALADPLHHYVEIARALLLRGTDFGSLWPHAFALVLIAALLFGASAYQFRRQINA